MRTRLSHFALLAVLLVGLGGLAVLTRLSLTAHRLQQQTAHSLLTGLATRVAARIETDAEAQLYISATAIFGRAGLTRISVPGKPGTPEAILDAVPAVVACNCANVLQPRYAFRADLNAGTIRVVAADTAAPPPALDLAVLRADLGARARNGGWEFAIANRLGPGGVVLFYTLVAGQQQIIAGFAVDTAVVRYRILRELFTERGAVLAAAGLRASDSTVMSLQVRAQDGSLLGDFPAASVTDLHGVATIPIMFGGWTVSVGLNREMVAGALGADVARSPLTLMLVLASLAALALIIAWSAAKRAADLAAIRATLIAGMSHELRTPLTEILLVGESIQRGRYGDARELAGAVDIVVREAHRLLRMISNVLHISTTGGITPGRATPQRLGDEVRRVVEDFSGIAAGYQCPVTVRIEADDPVAVDLEAVRQILNNFLDNACRYGGAGLAVEVVLSREQGAVRLAVHDRGAGIAVADREAVWRPFVRARQSGGRELFGSGIGLAVARQLATTWRGTTGIASSPAGGASVYVDFPIAPGEA
ncbi:MAG: HAMP domain-containing sensor histidine kinase [Gemmatimonadota bacterium]